MRRASLILLLAACRQPDPPPIGDSFTDSFDRADIGSDYRATADVYRIKDGALNVQNGYNHPLWLRKKLPDNAIVEVDVTSRSAAGDIKIELWGDGASYAENRGAYTSSGYDFIFGGWNNSRSIIARGNEHGQDVAQRNDPKVEVGRKYHWKIVRQGGHIDWFVDNMAEPFLTLEDKQPLVGPGHEYLGFDDWETDVSFDNLVVRKLG
jgi:Farnesoic acid 0-methyl transferase